MAWGIVRRHRRVAAVAALVAIAAGTISVDGRSSVGPAPLTDVNAAVQPESAFTGRYVLTWGSGQPGEFDPSSGRWLPVPVPPSPWTSGESLAWGAWTRTSLVLLFVNPRVEAMSWAPGEHRWTRLGTPGPASWAGRGIIGAGGKVYIVGTSGAVDEIDPGHGGWHTAPWKVPSGFDLAGTDGSSFVAFNDDPGPPLSGHSQAAVIDPATGSVRLTALGPPVLLAAVAGDRLFAWADNPDDPPQIQDRLEILNLSSGLWEQAPASPLQAHGTRRVLWTGSQLLVMSTAPAGEKPSPYIVTAADWNPANNSWYSLGRSLPVPAACQQTAALLQDDSNQSSVPVCLTSASLVAAGKLYHPFFPTAPACRADQLTANAHYAGGSVGIGGSTEEFIAVTNTSSTPCTLSRIPQITLGTLTGRHLSVKAVVDPDANVVVASGEQVAQGTVQLDPGLPDAAYLESPYSDVGVRDLCTRFAASFPSAVLTFPTGTVVAVPKISTGDDRYYASLLDCNGTMTISPWRATYWTA